LGLAENARRIRVNSDRPNIFLDVQQMGPPISSALAVAGDLLDPRVKGHIAHVCDMLLDYVKNGCLMYFDIYLAGYCLKF
jgi:hypothetical protein